MGGTLRHFGIVCGLISLLALSGCGGGGGSSHSGTASLSGTVFDAYSGDRIAGAIVTVTTPDGAPARAMQTTTSDDSGRYLISGVPCGDLQIRVEPPGGSHRSVEFNATLSKDGIQISPSLLPSTATENVSISLSTPDMTLSVGSGFDLQCNVTPMSYNPFYYVTGNIGVVDSQGSFLATNPGTGTVVAQVGIAKVVVRVTVTGRSSSASIIGLIVDEDGKPFPGAEVVVPGDLFYRPPIYTDFNGRFILSGLTPGGFEIKISSPGHGDIDEHVTLAPGQVLTMTRTLRISQLKDLAITPSSITLDPGGYQNFVVTASNAVEPAMKFRVLEADGGSFGDWWSGYNSCTYIAPNMRGTYHVIAEHILDPTQKVVATVTVKAGTGEVVIE